MEKAVKSQDGILNGFFSRLLPKSRGELAVYIAMLLMPSFVLVSFQAYNPAGGSYIFSSVLLGLALGAVCLILCKGLVPSVLKGNYILKTVALLSPAALLLSFGVELYQSTVLYMIIFLIFFALVYIGFVFPIKDRSRHICAVVILVMALFAIEYSICVYDLYSPDSFSYFDIGKNLFHSFYSVDTIRQYIVDTDLGISFPYLYPSIVAIVCEATGLQIYSGTVINIVIACATCLLLWKISVKHFKTPYPAALAVIYMLSNDQYLNEMRVARSVPLTILCICVLAYYILDLPKLKTKGAVLAGVGAGAAIVCRFDALAVAGLCLVAVFVFSEKGGRIKNTAKYTGGLLIPTLPWILFSLINFGKLWISDNGGTMWLMTPSIPQRYYSSGYVVPSIFTDFGEWLRCLFVYKFNWIWNSITKSCIPVAVLIILLAWAVVVLVRFGFKGGFKNYLRSNKRLLISAGVCLLIYAAKFCEIWIVGFSDARYHCESFIMIILFLSAVVCSIAAFSRENVKGKGKKTKSGYSMLSRSVFAGVSTVAVCVLMIAFSVNENKYLDRYTPNIMLESYLTKPASVVELEKAVTQKISDPIVFFCGDDGDPFTFGPYTGLRTYTPPKTRNGDTSALLEITDNYIMPDYVICKPSNLRTDFSARYGLKEVYNYYDYYSVYEVTNKSTFAAEKKLFPLK